MSAEPRGAPSAIGYNMNQNTGASNLDAAFASMLPPELGGSPVQPPRILDSMVPGGGPPAGMISSGGMMPNSGMMPAGGMVPSGGMMPSGGMPGYVQQPYTDPAQQQAQQQYMQQQQQQLQQQQYYQQQQQQQYMQPGQEQRQQPMPIKDVAGALPSYMPDYVIAQQLMSQQTQQQQQQQQMQQQMQQQQVAAQPQTDLHSGLATPMANLLRFLTALISTPPGVPDFPMAVQVQWGNTPLPATRAEVQAAVARLGAVPQQTLALLLQSLSTEQREFLHGFAMHVSMAMKDELPELGLGLTISTWLAGQVLPALQAFPEDARNGTTAEIRRNVGALVEFAGKVRPDATNPAFQAMATELDRTRSAYSASAARLSALGADPATGTPDTDKQLLQQQYEKGKNSTRSTITGLAVGIAVIGVLAIVGLFIMYKRCNKRASQADGGQGKQGQAGVADATGTGQQTLSSMGRTSFNGSGGIGGSGGNAFGMGGLNTGGVSRFVQEDWAFPRPPQRY